MIVVLYITYILIVEANIKLAKATVAFQAYYPRNIDSAILATTSIIFVQSITNKVLVHYENDIKMFIRLLSSSRNTYQASHTIATVTHRS